MAFTSRTLGLARAAVSAVGAVIDAAVRAITAAWSRAWGLLAGRFVAALEDLLTGKDRWPARRELLQDPGLQGALDDAGRALDVLSDLAAAETERAAAAAVERAAADQADMIGSQLPPDQDTRPGGHGSRRQALGAIRTRVGQRIISLTRPLSRDADQVMRRELVRGVRLGAGPRETATRMVGRMEGAFAGGLTRAMAIARTETLDAYRQAAAAVQEESREVLCGWVWLAELSDSTCVACWVMHGTEHPLAEPGPLGHVSCRCSRAPLTRSWADLGFPGVEEPPNLIRDAQVAFRALPRARQLAVMGRARLAALDRGNIAWADLVTLRQNPGWRPSYVPTPVHDLRRRRSA